jgi:hypothetical protein
VPINQAVVGDSNVGLKASGDVILQAEMIKLN